MTTTKLKKCKRCGIPKPATRKYFWRHHTNADRLNGSCIECLSELAKRKKRTWTPSSNTLYYCPIVKLKVEYSIGACETRCPATTKAACKVPKYQQVMLFEDSD